MFDIVILTDAKHAFPKSITNYTNNVIIEDALVQNALGAFGLKTLRIAWDNKNFDWTTTKYVLFRTTWDYFDRFTKFSKWLENTSKQTQLINSYKTITWNLDKHYLIYLKNKGIHIAETFFIEKGQEITLCDLQKQLNWEDMVLKPCISGAARHTYKLNSSNIKAHEAIFKTLIKEEALMLQPFQHHIISKGEISLMVINGKFTHAVLKKAKTGDFRVQDDFGGTVHNYTPTKQEIQFAENAVKACPELPLYARVDVFTDNQCKLAVAELELIEPELWFRNYPKTAQILAKSIYTKYFI